LGLIIISGFAGFLPVVSCVLMDKWLIINTIHFSGMVAFAGWWFVRIRIYRILRFTGCGLLYGPEIC
jgi:hypothetical protein